MAEKLQPVSVLYCAVCGLPPEYCEFGSDFDKCKPWLIQNVPALYPHLLKDVNVREADKVADKLQSTGLSSRASGRAASSAPKQEEVKLHNGVKIKKKDKQEVVIGKVSRNNQKCINTRKGLELFGELSDVNVCQSLQISTTIIIAHNVGFTSNSFNNGKGNQNFSNADINSGGVLHS